MKKRYNTSKGSVALISVLIAMAVLMIIAVGMSETHISTSKQYLNTQANREIYYAAEACLEDTIKRIEENIDFSGGSLSINNNDITCTITATGTTVKNIEITITKDNYIQEYLAEINIVQKGNTNNATINKWERSN